MQLLRLRHLPGIPLQSLWMLVVPLALLTSAPHADAAERPMEVQVGGGVRFFSQQLALNDNVCAGVRMGLGVSDRLSFAIDYLFSAPTRPATNAIAYISSLRALTRFDILSGSTRPYAIAGVGGVMMNFNDARDYSTGTLIGGLGLSRSLGRNHFVSVEGDIDLYASRVEYYDLQGQPIYKGIRTYERLASLTANVGVRF